MKAACVIAGVGARTSVAQTAMHSGFLLRAGTAGMMEAALVDATGEPITACFLPTIDPLVTGANRASELAVGALRETLASLGPACGDLRIKLVLCVDEHLTRPSASGAPAGAVQVLARTHFEARKIVPNTVAEVCARGAASPGFCLGDALGALGGSADIVLLGGVHTDYDPEIIQALDAKGRIYRDDNIDALIPGEAAAFVALTRREIARTNAFKVHAQLHTFATAFEKATVDNDESAFEAAGLTVAVKRAGAPLLDEQLTAGWVLTDLTFEQFRLLEWQAVSVRARKIFGQPYYVDSPAQRLGHLGAAAMPLHFALAAEAWRRGYAPSPIAMSIAGSDSGERAAVLLSELQGA